MSILFIFVLLLHLWALYELLLSNANLVNKALWAVLIVAVPVLGVILWYLLGPKSENESAPAAA